ncbi:hypothetical protein HYW59_03985 [Candidatus Kaiserbacteria bacterium]|nr:hypothetical protein [Candidatus Kaiserbacteria bacterium]
MSSTLRAGLATIIFAIAGLASFYFEQIWWEPTGIPLAVFYALLILNTFFSVRFFSSLLPADLLQKVIDTVLLAFYLLLAFSMNDEVRFFLIALGLFLVASVKYVFLLKHTSYEKILRRKIRVNLVGAAACGAAWGGVVLGYPLESVWMAVVAFAIANIHLLLIRPIYVLEQKS